jgi:hypothetical protein
VFAALVCLSQRWQVEATGLKMSDFDLKKIYTSPDGNIYSFSGYGGVENCSDCDDFTQVNEYDRDDGLVVFFCNKCEDRLHL